jgi:hypothetical protein
MGRPLNKKYIGKRNVGSTGSANEYSDSSANIPGQTVSNIIVGTAGSYTTATLGGTPAIAANGVINSFTATSAALPQGTQVVVSGSVGTGTLANGTYYVGPGATTTSITLYTAVGGTGTVVTTVAGTTSQTFTYVQLATLTFPAPALAGEGGTTATGTPNYFVSSAAVATTSAGTGFASQIGQTLTVANQSVGTVANLAATSTITSITIANTTGSLTVTSGTYYQGQSIYIQGALTNGSITGYDATNGTTYYISSASGTGLTTINITDTYANALAGTNALTTVSNASAIASSTKTLGGGALITATASNIVLTSTSGAFTVPAGNYYTGQQIVITGTNSGTSNVAASTIYVQTGGVGVTSITTASSFANAVAGTGGNTYTLGASGTVTGLVFQFGNGTGAANIIATGSSSVAFSITAAVTPTSPVAGTQVPTSSSGKTIGQTLQFTYGLVSANITAGGQGYISDGTSGAVKTVRSVTISATNSTGNTVTVSSTNEIVPGMVLTTAAGTAVGNIAQSTAYYVLTVTNLTTLTLATSYANYQSATAMTQTTASSGALTATVTQYALVTIGGVGTGSPAATISLLAEVTSGFGASNRYASIVGMAWITGDTQVRMAADIVKQVGARSFRVNTTASDTSSGTLTKLVGNFPTVAGTMAIGATDSAGGTYFVTKLTNRKVSLTPGGSNAGTQFGTSSTPAMAKWTTGSAVANVSVTIDNV